MLDHISIPVTDLDASAIFYDGVFGVLGYKRIKESGLAIGYGHRLDLAPRYWILKRNDANYAQPGLGLHISFRALSKEAVDEFYKTALELGGKNAGLPGPRAEYTQPFYGAFVFDPDGFKIEAVCRS